MRFRFIEAERACYPIRLLCRCLAVSRFGYYAWRRRAPSARAREDARLRGEVAASHSASRRTYGSPRILRDLREDGHRVSRKRVSRLMRELGLEGRRKRRFRATTDSRHRFPVVRRCGPSRCASFARPSRRARATGRGRLSGSGFTARTWFG